MCNFDPLAAKNYYSILKAILSSVYFIGFAAPSVLVDISVIFYDSDNSFLNNKTHTYAYKISFSVNNVIKILMSKLGSN